MASILRRGTCLSSCYGMVQLKWKRKDPLSLFSMCRIYTKHKWISKKKKTVEKKSSHSWRLFVKSMCFGLSALHQAASAHLFVLGSGIERWNPKAAKDFICLPFSQWTNGQVTFRLGNYCLTFLIEVLTTRTLALSALNTFELWNRGRK